VRNVRNFLPISQIPKVMQDAVLAAEDSRFYQHSGVNYISVIRAGLANFGEARSAQGASTITMQVARNFYLSTEKTLTRKIYEVLLSMKIESSADEGADPRGLHEPHSARTTSVRLLHRQARSTSASPEEITIAEARCWRVAQGAIRETTRSSIRSGPGKRSATSSIG
jgi:hypothetical protein